MTQQLATLLYCAVIVTIFFLDRDREVKTSKALWIPTAWLFFCLSRSVSQWLGANPTAEVTASTYVEGSPVDAACYAVIEAAALVAVIARWRRVWPVLVQNWPFGLFFSYAALSIFWSDFPFVTFKHWIKGIGDVMMVMIVLTEPSVPAAIKRLFTRLGFVLLPLSLLFIKYYPSLGRRLTLSWTMEPVGVAQQKNGLGELCDFLGLALLWCLRSAYNDRAAPDRKRRMLALGVVLALVVWLLWLCNSMTSICALGMASALMLLSTTPALRIRPSTVHLLILGLFSCSIYALFFQSSGSLLESLGRDPSLTGRTDIWRAVIKIPSNVLVGTGYESFWLGPRLEQMWQAARFRVNEAHNGYIEILITLGWIGEILLGILIATGYRNVIGAYRRDPEIGSLRMAFFLASLTTALTEAAFRMMGPPWIIFLLATAAAPWYAAHKSSGRNRGNRQASWPLRERDAVREEVPGDH